MAARTSEASDRQPSLEVARQPLHLPVAVARGVEAAAAVELGRRIRLGLGAPRLRFGERPSRRRREIACGRLAGLAAGRLTRVAVVRSYRPTRPHLLSLRSAGRKPALDFAYSPALGGRQFDSRRGGLARQSGGFHAGRPEAPAPPPPGLAARVAAARAVAEALTSSRPLEERLAADLAQQRGGLDARDRGLARSIATVSLRRLGTIRKALARRLEKGMPKRGGALEWTLIVAAAQILFLDIPDHAAVDLAVKATRAEPASAPFAALANAVLRAIARDRDEILASSDPLEDDTPAWLAQRWRSTYGESVARAIALAHRSEPTLDLSVKERSRRLGGEARGNRLADGLGAPRHPRAGRRARRLCGRRMVGAGRCGGLAGPAPPAGSRHADRRPLRRAGRKSSRTGRGGGRSHDGRSLGRAAQAACRQFRPPAPSLGGRGRRRPPLRCAAIRRRAPGRAVQRDRHHPPPSRRRLDQATGRP